MSPLLESLSDMWTFFREVATVLTPFGVLFLTFRAANRKSVMDATKSAIDSMQSKLDEAQKESREDTKAITTQIGAFQREVANEYVRRVEVNDMFRDIRSEIRDMRRDDHRS